MIENYGVYLTPHFEKYQTQDQSTSDCMQATWSFGNKLKGQGYKIAYMHGPVGYYESLLLQTLSHNFTTKDHIKEFVEFYNKEQVFFLYQKLKKSIRFAQIAKEVIKQNREANKQSRRKSIERSKHESEKDKD